MIENVKVSLVMNFIIETAKYHLKQSGGVDPQLFFLRGKGKYEPIIRVEGSDPFKKSSIFQDYTEVDMSDETFKLELEGMLYVLQSSSMEDDLLIDRFIRTFISANDIEIVAFVMIGYRKKVDLEERGKKDLNTDIEATRVLHATYGLRGSRDLYTMTTPIVEVGKKKPTEDNPTDIHTVLTPWKKCNDDNFSRLETIAQKNGGSLWN